MNYYFDYCAAAPLRPEAAAVIEKILRSTGSAIWANPSSGHHFGRYASRAIENARDQVARCLGCARQEIVFTSGATEACATGIRGMHRPGGTIVTTGFEHKAVASAIASAQANQGGRAAVLTAEMLANPGMIRWSDVCDKPNASLLAVQWVNHETGVILPIAELAHSAKAAGLEVFVDASQAVGRVAIDLGALPIDALALAGHKVGGPTGSGALFIRKGAHVEPLIDGSQERGRRGGTQNAMLIGAFGAAMGAVHDEVSSRDLLYSRWRDAFEEVATDLGGVVNGLTYPRVASIVSVAFGSWQAPLLVAALDVEGLAVAAGPACSSGMLDAESTLAAMYPAEKWRADSAIRISFGHATTQSEVDAAIVALRRVIKRAV